MEDDEKSVGGAWRRGRAAPRRHGSSAAQTPRSSAQTATHAHGPGLRHARVWLCEVCEHAPAAVTCRADVAALYTACDADIHSANPLACRHEQLPVVPFFGTLADALKPFASSGLGPEADVHSASVADDDGSNKVEAASWLLPEPDHRQQKDKPIGATDVYFADSNPYLDLDFARSMDDIKAIGVQSGPRELNLTGVKLFYSDHSMNHSVSSSEAAVVPDAAAGAAPVPVVSKGREREARLIRYREKRKSQRSEKTIRYASRKAYAETRPRIKGRFARRTAGAGAEAEGEDAMEHEEIYSSATAAVAALMAPGLDADYGVDGVVPTF